MPGPLNHDEGPRRNPVPTVDVIIEYGSGIVLIERRNPPHGWALPGGFIEYGESAESAAAREVKEETGLSLEALEQFRVYSDPRRDCRMHTITIVFSARGRGRLAAGDDAAGVRVFPPEELPDRMAFDHAGIVADYLRKQGSRRA